MKKRIVLLLMTVLMMLSLTSCNRISNYFEYRNDKLGKKQPDISYTLTIEKSDFENEVAVRLEENGIIVSAVRFLGYVKEEYPDFVWYNGVYDLTADMSYEEICAKLQDASCRIEYVKFTVPEGKTVRDIASIVEKAGICTADEFLAAADSYDYDHDIIKTIQTRDASKIGYKLEGYLFPATYEFRKDTVTPREVVEEMLTAFENYMTKDVIQKAETMGLDINELISFASVIQAEAFTKESMQYISSVFWNRLNSDYKRFESDPTMFYAKDLSVLPHFTQEMKNAYDTYKCVGTPVGPINCPGMDTINAVVNPADTDYFYFITDSEGNFYYNKTYAEHVADCYATGLWKR